MVALAIQPDKAVALARRLALLHPHEASVLNIQLNPKC
jgi:hypothetical protein